MGAAAGIAGGLEFHEQFNELFVDAAIREAELLFRTDRTARRSFVEFIKNGTWSELLGDFERPLRDGQMCDTAWRKFGYRDPYVKTENCSRSCSFDSNKSTNSVSTRSGIGVSTSENSRKSKIAESYSATSTWTLFEDKELLPVLCFVLLPFYLRSEEFRAWQDPTFVPRVRSTSSGSVDTDPERSSDDKHQRLQDLLIGTAALYDSAELTFYLADPDHSWVEAFKSALVNLPVTLMISRIKRETREAKVIFVNHDPSGSFRKNRSERAKMRSYASVIGQELADVCSEQLSPGASRQIELAIFNGRAHKMSILDGQACKLRTLSPIFKATREHAYTVALETACFENPAQLSLLGMTEQIEKPFQQIEDLLALLPMLIKM